MRQAFASRWRTIVLECLELHDFRNYAHLRADLNAGSNLFFGANGAGKTNLLEAVYYLALARSPRTARDGDLVRQGAERFALRGKLTDGALEIVYHPARGCTVRVDGQKCTRQSDLYGRVTAVFFSPDDLWLAKGGPAARRRLLDSLLVQIRPTYAVSLARYEDAIIQRNALLREVRTRRSGPALLEIWEESLVEYGVEIALRRAWLSGVIGLAAQPLYRSLASGERLTCRYASGIGDDWSEETFRGALGRTRAADIERGFTGVGPHRDDLVCELDGRAVRLFASQGQQRSTVLALKLAAVSALRSATGEQPILLLDDVLSELDAERRSGLAEIIAGGGQVLLTATDAEALPHPLRNAGRAFLVKDGQVRPLAA